MAPPPLSDLLDWRVPYVELSAMICVSRVKAIDGSLEGLRLPPLTGFPSPAARANGAMATATSAAEARMNVRLLMVPPTTQEAERCAVCLQEDGQPTRTKTGHLPGT